MADSSQRNLWLWVIPVLLFATALAVQRLNWYGLDHNELFTRNLVGGDPLKTSFRFAEGWSTITEGHPDQAYGLLIIYAIWCSVFGWSNFALRILPLFAGLLSICWTFRMGRDLFSPLAGLIAILLLSTSVFYITFFHLARTYSLVAMFAMMALWGYWRLTTLTESLGMHRVATLAFLLGSIGILYTQYYSGFVLVAIGLWHLLFMPKNREWWQIWLLFILVGVTFIPSLPGFLRGLTHTQTAPWHTDADQMLRIREVLPWFLHVLTNGIVNVSGIMSIVLLFIWILMIAVSWLYFQRREWYRESRYFLLVTCAVLLLMLAGNEILLIFRSYRLRYLIALWPLFALLAGWLIWRMSLRRPLLAGLFTGVVMANGIWLNTASDIRYEFYDVLHRFPSVYVHKELERFAAQEDLLLADFRIGYNHSPFPNKQLVFDTVSTGVQEAVNEVLPERLRVWLFTLGNDEERQREMTALVATEMVNCGRFLDRDEMHLDLYAWTATHCPGDEPAKVRFGDEVNLAALDVSRVAKDSINVELLVHADHITGLTAFSVTLQIFEIANGRMVLQDDRGLWLGRYNPVSSEIDISTLAAGEYELKIGVYNWQTLERLDGVNLESGVRADLLTLSRFRVE